MSKYELPVRISLDEDEMNAFSEFCQDNDINHLKGIKLLIRNFLIENDDVSIDETKKYYGEQKMKLLEEWCLEYEVRIRGNFRRNEKLEEQITEIQVTLDSLRGLKTEVEKHQEAIKDLSEKVEG